MTLSDDDLIQLRALVAAARERTPDLVVTNDSGRTLSDAAGTLPKPVVETLDLLYKAAPDLLEEVWKERTKERKVACGVAVFIVSRDHEAKTYGKILMGQRKGSHGAGTWCLPGGWMRHGESFQQTVEREVYEETGLKVLGDVALVDVKNTRFKDRDVQSITLSFVAPTWLGTPVAKEPDKLEGGWQWVDPLNPPQPLFEPINNPGPYGFTKEALAGLQGHESDSVFALARAIRGEK